LPKEPVVRKQIKSWLVSYSFLVPFGIFFAVFIAYPICHIFFLCFQSGTFLNRKFAWTGLDNFKTVLSNPDFINSFVHSLIYILIAVPVGQIIALFLAFLIQKKNRAGTVYESIFFLPLLVSMAAASVVIAYTLSPNGPLNAILQFFGLERINWFGQSFTALLAVMILELWKGVTFHCFVYMSALRAIPEDYAQAARIDGANIFQETFRVILPMLRNSIVLCVTMTTIWQFQIFESVYMLTGGGPVKSTESVVFSIYRYTFRFGRVGMGAAASVLFLFFILAICGMEMLIFRLSGDKDSERIAS
jgi:ABC-type sugar transport system permease subunit